MRIKMLVLFGKFVISSVFYYTGAISVFNILKSLLGFSEVKILAYHNISNVYPKYLDLSQPPKLFESQIKYLKKKYEVISITKALEFIKNRTSLKKDKIVITFDDNYHEFYTEVFPIKKKYDVPMTVFVAVGPLDTGQPLFVDSLIHAIHYSRKRILDLSALKLGQYPISSKDEKNKTIVEINERSKDLSSAKRKRMLSEIFAQLNTGNKNLNKILLTWDEIQEMKDEGMIIGAHTINHPELTKIPLTEAKYEIYESKRKLEEKLHARIDYFAYPYGENESYNKIIKGFVKKAGFLGGCSLNVTEIRNDLHAINRINVDSSMSSLRNDKFFKPLFALELSGLANYMFLRFLKNRKLTKSRSNYNKHLKIVNVLNERKIKCLYIIDQLNNFAGSEKHLLQLTSQLNDQKFSVNVIAFNASVSMINEFDREGVSVYSLDLDRIYGIRACRKFVSLVSKIQQYKPDIVQTFHFMSDTFGVAAAVIAGVSNVISSRRDMGDLKKARQLYLNRLINPLIKKYISVCDRVGREISIVEKIPKSRIQTIYNGVDMARFERDGNATKKAREKLGICEDSFVVGNVCILRPEKDVHLFLNAMSELNKLIENLVILVVGNGQKMKDLIRYSQVNGIYDKTIFTGYVRDIRDYVKAMDIACLTPKENEGLSNVILEEMAMGKPVIATDVGGNSELIVNGVTGFITRKGVKEDLIRCIMTLYENPMLKNSMGDKARQRVKQYFTIEGMIKKMEKFYFDLTI